MTDANTTRFNAEAAAWDNNPDVHVASEGAFKAILERFPELEESYRAGSTGVDGPDILEIGCGTGVLSLKIAPYAKSLIAVDAASGMIDALKVKLAKPSAPKTIQPLAIMLEDPEDPRMPPANGETEGPRKKFDLILSHLVLHHIPELEPLLATMHGCLKPGGCIALTDFEDCGAESRKFHPEAKMSGVERHGIDRRWFEGLIKDAGFVNIDVGTGFTMSKDVERFPGEWGQKKPDGELEKADFPFLLCTAQKP